MPNTAVRPLLALTSLLPLVLLLRTTAQALILQRAVAQARAGLRGARGYEHRPPQSRARVLVLGDSTGVGIGAERPADSVAGLLAAEHPGAEVVNLCRAGARAADVLAQLERRAFDDRAFDLVLLHVGGNDVLRLTPQARLDATVERLLPELARIARRRIWLSSANVGLAPLFMAPFSWFYSARTRRVFARCADAAARHGVEFVNFYRPAGDCPFARDIETYYASDRLHPSSASYRYCWEVLKRECRLHGPLRRRRAPPRARGLPATG